MSTLVTTICLFSGRVKVHGGRGHVMCIRKQCSKKGSLHCYRNGWAFVNACYAATAVDLWQSTMIIAGLLYMAGLL